MCLLFSHFVNIATGVTTGGGVKFSQAMVCEKEPLKMLKVFSFSRAATEVHRISTLLPGV